MKQKKSVVYIAGWNKNEYQNTVKQLDRVLKCDK